MPSPSLPISALPEIRELIDGAENILKADISRIKKLLADPDERFPRRLLRSLCRKPRTRSIFWPLIRAS